MPGSVDLFQGVYSKTAKMQLNQENPLWRRPLAESHIGPTHLLQVNFLRRLCVSESVPIPMLRQGREEETEKKRRRAREIEREIEREREKKDKNHKKAKKQPKQQKETTTTLTNTSAYIQTNTVIRA